MESSLKSPAESSLWNEAAFSDFMSTMALVSFTISVVKAAAFFSILLTCKWFWLLLPGLVLVYVGFPLAIMVSSGVIFDWAYFLADQPTVEDALFTA